MKHPLLTWLAEVGQSTYWLADQLECDRAHLYRIMLGERMASMELAAKLATFTKHVHPPGVTVEQMVPERLFRLEE